ncbi:PREDICTED: zinc finger and BTB domain-containing protein 39 [Nanorana parkeri]|uniref:zinc finger and BTB domain-containing protein 39 n=1 Tax=Nanorana parkeri TaxID=125878 RepID=UPI000854DA21|nr:PREDICTED: zinc finger and BTB domain-containing protein 39 [Nanorana parkeri]
MGMRIKLNSRDHPSNLLRELNQSRLSGTFCDVNIVVGNRSFSAHKAVLGSAAAYFQKLFLNADLDIARTYVVDFITPTNFEKVLSFIYTSELFTDLINVGVIYEVAEKLGMADLIKACHATFPDLEGSSGHKNQCSVSSSEGRSGALSVASTEHYQTECKGNGVDNHLPPTEKNYSAQTDVSGSLKGEEHEANINQTAHFPLTAKTEEQSSSAKYQSSHCAMNTGFGPTSTCPPYKTQHNGDYNKIGYFPGDSSASGNSKESAGGFEAMGDLQLEDLEEETLQFDEAGDEDSGPSGEIIELSDGSEDELLLFGQAENQSGKAMPCQVCKKVLEPNLQRIRQHAREHVDLVKGSCKVCQARFHDRGAMITHVLSHIGIFLFSCDMCEDKFFSQWQLTLHRGQEGVTSEHNIIVQPGQPLPGEVNTFVGALGTELQCGACHRTMLRDFHSVRSHALDHLNNKNLSCGLCDHRHLTLCGLMWHVLSHMSISVFSCSLCASSFLDRHLLEKHMAVHQSTEEALFRCHLCSQGFKSETAYRQHLSQHRCGSIPMDRPGFSEFSQIQIPLSKRKAPEDFTVDDHSVVGQTGHSKYTCKVCGKCFSHTSEFNYHRRIHTGEKPYQCKVCLKFFRGRSTIKCHLKTHAGALMYRCTVCGHYSSTLNLMGEHIAVHRGNLPSDFTIDQTFMYTIHSKETDKTADS